MGKTLLLVENLSVAVEGKMVLADFDLEVRASEVVALTGPNGSGKTTLAQVLMGNSKFEIRNTKQIRNTKPTSPKIIFEGKNLLKMTIDERARAGLYVAWQSPVAIPGVTVFSLCKALGHARGKLEEFNSLGDFKKYLEGLAVKVGLNKEYIGRNVNEGFSGGERKRLELLQLLLFAPKLAVLDEIDSGLDARGVEILKEIIGEMKLAGTSFVLITHSKKLLNELEVDKTWKITN